MVCWIFCIVAHRLNRYIWTYVYCSIPAHAIMLTHMNACTHTHTHTVVCLTWFVLLCVWRRITHHKIWAACGWSTTWRNSRMAPTLSWHWKIKVRLFAGTVAELLFNTFLSKRVLLITGRATQTGFLPRMNMEGRTQMVCPSYRLFEAFSLISFCGYECVSVCKCACVSVCVSVSVNMCVCVHLCVWFYYVFHLAWLYLLDIWILDFVCVCVIF